MPSATIFDTMNEPFSEREAALISVGVPMLMLSIMSTLNSWFIHWPLDRVHSIMISVIYLLAAQALWHRLHVHRMMHHIKACRLNIEYHQDQARNVDIQAQLEEVEQESEGEENQQQHLIRAPPPIPAHVAPLISDVPRLVDFFLKQAANQTDWQHLITTKKDPQVQVHKNPKLSNYAFRVRGQIENSPAAVFDLLTNVEKRCEWDDMVDESRVVETIDTQTRVIYLRMKPIWPTSARDLVLLSSMRIYEGEFDGEKRKLYLNVTRSIQHPNVPERSAEGIVRMTMGGAGQLLYAVKNPDGSAKPKYSELIQVADVNPNGWIPASVVNFAATQAVPDGFYRLNEVVKPLEAIEKSRFEVIANAPKPDQVKLIAIPPTKASPMMEPPKIKVTKPTDTPPKRPSSSPSHRRMSQAAGIHMDDAPRIRRRRSAIEVAHGQLEQAAPWMVAALFGITVTNVAVRYLQIRRPSG